MKTALIAACLAGAALSLPAFAGDADKAHKMDMMDTNKDGMVSHDEHKAAMDKKFADADSNGDGMLSATEKSAKKLDMKDANNDGSVSRDEFNTAGETKFAAADTNKDNSLSKDELTAMWKAHH